MLRTILLSLMTLSFLTACSSYSQSGGDPQAKAQQQVAQHNQEKAIARHGLEEQAHLTLEQFRMADPSLATFFKNSAGYAVYPQVTKGAVGIGAAHGNGILYENGRVVGTTEVSQGSIGFQLGGQVYSELIFFETPVGVAQFKQGNMEFSAQASAVAAAKGAGANADYANGIAVFTTGEKGLMFEASIGGQKFSFQPN